MNSERLDRPRTRVGGFTFVEIIVAVVVLAVGVLGMVGTTAYVIRQVTLAEVTTRRAAALQSVVERLRATDYTSLAAGADSLDGFSMRWTVTADGTRSSLVTIQTVGPGLYSDEISPFPMLRDGVADTFVYRVIRP